MNKSLTRRLDRIEAVASAQVGPAIEYTPEELATARHRYGLAVRLRILDELEEALSGGDGIPDDAREDWCQQRAAAARDLGAYPLAARERDATILAEHASHQKASTPA